MCISVKQALNRTKDNAFLMNFIWLRLLEKEIARGVDTHITMDLPMFNQ
jgi:hypothetical protein